MITLSSMSHTPQLNFISCDALLLSDSHDGDHGASWEIQYSPGARPTEENKDMLHLNYNSLVVP